jgi:hypothetical protein
MAVNHASLTDPELHEPKGIASANDGDVYIADGAGSGEWKQGHFYFGGFIGFNASSPYSLSVGTTDTIINPTFTVADNFGFTGVTTPNARIVYDGNGPIHVGVDFIASIKQSSGGSKDIQLVLLKNGVALAGSRQITTAPNGVWQKLSIHFNDLIDEDDFFEVAVQADTSATVNFANGYLRILGAP